MQHREAPQPAFVSLRAVFSIGIPIGRGVYRWPQRPRPALRPRVMGRLWWLGLKPGGRFQLPPGLHLFDLQGARSSISSKNGCSEDLPDSQARHGADRFAVSCFCDAPSERRTARRTSTGMWSRTSVSTTAGWCSVMCCISARSTPRKRRRGARRSRCSTMMPAVHGRWRCFRRINARRSRATPPSFNFGYPRCGFTARGNGAPAGWPGSCGRSCSSIGSGPIACRRTGKEHGGIRFCRFLPPTG